MSYTNRFAWEHFTDGQIAKMRNVAHMYRSNTIIDSEPAFKDDDLKDNVFYHFISSLKEAGISNGYDDNTFRPYELIL